MSAIERIIADLTSELALTWIDRFIADLESDLPLLTLARMER